MLPQLKLICASSICLVVYLFFNSVSSQPAHAEFVVKQLQTKQNRIMEEGRQAALKGLPNTDNPYLNPYASLSPEESAWWFDGWLQVYKQAERVKWGLN